MRRVIIYAAAVAVFLAVLLGADTYTQKKEASLGSEVVSLSQRDSEPSQSGSEPSQSGSDENGTVSPGDSTASPGDQKTVSGDGTLQQSGSDENGTVSLGDSTVSPGDEKTVSGDGTLQQSGSDESEEADSVSSGDTQGQGTGEDDTEFETITAQGKVKLYDNGVAVVGDAAYEIYNYTESSAKNYAKAVNKLTKELGSAVTVYDLIVPTSMDITFPDNKRKSVNSSDQKQAIENIQGMLSGREVFVPLYSALMQHRTEYIYFRTDHHWTSLGAYYAYREFCSAKGIEPHEKSAYQKQKVKGFSGSFYRDTGGNKNLKTDTMNVFYPLSKNLTMKYTTTSGKKIFAPVIADATNYGASLKYSAYIAGDNPYTVIRNKDIKDGSSCVVVKESYGNAFVPFLADHYGTIYVVDYRYWDGCLTDLVREKEVPEVILINNISMTRNSYLVGKFAGCIR